MCKSFFGLIHPVYRHYLHSICIDSHYFQVYYINHLQQQVDQITASGIIYITLYLPPFESHQLTVPPSFIIMAAWLDITSILAEEERVPCTFTVPGYQLGMLDPGSVEQVCAAGQPKLSIPPHRSHTP